MGVVKLSLVFFVCFFFTDVCGLKTSCKVCDEKKYNLTAEEVFPKIKELVPRVWAREIPLTPLGRRYKKEILNLNQNGDLDNFKLAAGSTLYFNKFISYLSQKPDGCVSAAVVNGTLSCAVDHDQTLLQGALTQFQNTFPQTENAWVRTMIINGGCSYLCGKSLPNPQIKKNVCYKNGFVYPIENLWNLPGPPYANISPKFKNIVLDMYKSSNYVDNFLASITSFVLTEAFQKSFELWNSNIIVEAVEMAVSGPVGKKCCQTRYEAAVNNGKANIAEAIRTFDILKEQYSSTECQP